MSGAAPAERERPEATVVPAEKPARSADAIVTVENVTRLRERGFSAMQAAL